MTRAHSERERLRVVLVGAAAGWGIAFAIGHFFCPRPIAVSSTGPTAILAVPALLITVAAIASWIPACRAARRSHRRAAG
jgi:ABC-type antimicrobial peptide transport system permease subunit